MKTLVEKTTPDGEISNLSKYLFEDNETVTLLESHIVVGDPVEFHIGCHNSSDSTLFTNITPPSDWVGNKYTYTTDGGWVEVEGWVDQNE
jgi:hypothetical protein